MRNFGKTKDMSEQDIRVIARLEPAPGRRIFSLVALAGLGLLLVQVALARPPESIGWQVFLLVLGALALVLALRLWQATAHGLVLREDGLWEAGGRRLASIDEIASVDRGVFAFKPSNGFLVTLRRSAPRAWAPGLWWRLGRRIGVGGTTPGAAARAMADALAVMLDERRRRTGDG